MSILKSNLWLGHPSAPREKNSQFYSTVRGPLSLQLHCYKPIAFTPVPYQLHPSLPLSPRHPFPTSISFPLVWSRPFTIVPPPPHKQPFSSLFFSSLISPSTILHPALYSCLIPSISPQSQYLPFLNSNNPNGRLLMSACRFPHLILAGHRPFLPPVRIGAPHLKVLCCLSVDATWKCQRHLDGKIPPSCMVHSYFNIKALLVGEILHPFSLLIS